MSHEQHVESSAVSLHTPGNPLSLADWRKTVSHLYWTVRERSARGDPSETVWQDWQDQRNHLFKTHSQSALDDDQKANFEKLDFFPYNPKLRVIGKVVTEGVKKETHTIKLPHDGNFNFTRFAHVHFSIGDQPQVLSLYWVNGYGGGLFLPFKDGTNRTQTYGAGRYLFDAIKGADLGTDDAKGEIIIDFNYAYNPSCSYNSDWVCPLSPSENKLSIPIEAGEKIFTNSK
eukprot:TRINITY_DN12794_c0_g1_i1.p1 TRINITY_DN12794_c0_g1~~TRINITY_DN12794_c0_g1_i1.p1  ORF type:complete len:238 (-),score=66.48 TRINITY_DN12794_c0_g1_i1:39-728(-)